MKEYLILVDGKPADCYNFKASPAWKSAYFRTFKEACQRANEWINDFEFKDIKFEIGVPWSFHDTVGAKMSNLVILKVAFAKAIKDLKKLPEFKLEKSSYSCSMFFGSVKGFKFRLFVENNNDITIHFGIKDRFDRWANSTDFTLNVNYNSDYPYKVDMLDAFNFMNKVVKSGLFKHYGINITSECKMISNK